MKKIPPEWTYLMLITLPLVIGGALLYFKLGGVSKVSVKKSVEPIAFKGVPEKTPPAIQEQKMVEKEPSKIEALEKPVQKTEIAHSEPLKNSKESTGMSTHVPKVSRPLELCQWDEPIGLGPKAVIALGDWKKMMNTFHQAKQNLDQYLKKKIASNPTYKNIYLENQKILKRTVLIQPPFAEEPDIAWRGIPVLGDVMLKDSTKVPSIAIGAGFFTVLAEEPQRALFELTRLLVQAWSPCFFEKEGALDKGWGQTPWKHLLTCLHIEDSGTCGKNTEFEASWAISTTLAAELFPPGCLIPAFTNPLEKTCFHL